MLRIQLEHEDAEGVTLSVQGRLDAAWAELLESETRELRALGVPVVLDLSEVVFIGRSGVGALARLARSGVRLTGCSPLMTAILKQEGIVVDSSP